MLSAKKIRVFVAVLSFVIASVSPARAHANDPSEFQTWTALLGTGQLSEDSAFRYWFDGHGRRGQSATTAIVRPGVGYQVLPWMSLWAGYAWVPFFDEVRDRRRDEHRAWQQVILTHKLAEGRLGLQSRTRLEQRFVSGSDFDTGLRIRQFLRADYRFESAPDLALVLWDESFWGLNSPGFAPDGFDQNRVFVGPALFAHPRLRLEVGYLWAVLDRTPKTRHQHALAINFFVSLDPP